LAVSVSVYFVFREFPVAVVVFAIADLVSLWVGVRVFVVTISFAIPEAVAVGIGLAIYTFTQGTQAGLTIITCQAFDAGRAPRSIAIAAYGTLSSSGFRVVVANALGTGINRAFVGVIAGGGIETLDAKKCRGEAEGGWTAALDIGDALYAQGTPRPIADPASCAGDPGGHGDPGTTTCDTLFRSAFVIIVTMDRLQALDAGVKADVAPRVFASALTVRCTLDTKGTPFAVAHSATSARGAASDSGIGADALAALVGGAFVVVVTV
jgi:hypothetical protein